VRRFLGRARHRLVPAAFTAKHVDSSFARRPPYRRQVHDDVRRAAWTLDAPRRVSDVEFVTRERQDLELPPGTERLSAETTDPRRRYHTSSTSTSRHRPGGGARHQHARRAIHEVHFVGPQCTTRRQIVLFAIDLDDELSEMIDRLANQQ